MRFIIRRLAGWVFLASALLHAYDAYMTDSAGWAGFHVVVAWGSAYIAATYIAVNVKQNGDQWASGS